MSTSVSQGQSGRWFDVIVLIAFIVIGLGGLASIFFSSSQGLALIEFGIGFVGLVLAIGKVTIWKEMLQRKLEIVLRIVTAMLLLSIIALQSLILILTIGTQRTSTPPQGQPRAAKVQPTQTPTPTPTPTPTLTPTPTPPNVEITFPTQGSKVSSFFITVRGTASNLPAGKELWLFVTEEGVDGYYPQNTKPITIFSDGSWSQGTHIGQQNDPAAVGKTFTLFPALIDQSDSEAHNAIQAFFQTGQYNPIPSLPSGIQLLNPVQVVRE